MDYVGLPSLAPVVFTTRRYAIAGISCRRVLLFEAVCLYVCVCHIRRYRVGMVEPVELIFGTEATVDLSYTLCYKKNPGNSKNKRNSLFVLTVDLQNFATVRQSTQRVVS